MRAGRMKSTSFRGGTFKRFPNCAQWRRKRSQILKWVTLKYDNLYGFSFPYMMLLHQAPTRGRHSSFHFHIEFYPPHRSKEKLKYMASVETGSGAFLNDSLAEEKAAELRAAAPAQAPA